MIQGMIGRVRTTVALPASVRTRVKAYAQQHDASAAATLGDLAGREATATRPDRAKVVIDPESGFPYLDFSVGHIFTADEIADLIDEDA